MVGGDPGPRRPIDVAVEKLLDDFDANNLCDIILKKVFALEKNLEPVLTADNGTTPGVIESSSLMMRLQTIDGHLDKLLDRTVLVKKLY